MSRARLNFPPYAFRITLRDGQEHIWDSLRGAWLCLTPEEWVRQHAVRWLAAQRGVAAQYIVQEYPIDISGTRQRADVIVVQSDGRPLLLAECKAPGVAIDAAVLAQAVRYNSIAGARYIMLTNGMRHYFYESEGDGRYRPLDSLPNLGDGSI